MTPQVEPKLGEHITENEELKIDKLDSSVSTEILSSTGSPFEQDSVLLFDVNNSLFIGQNCIQAAILVFTILIANDKYNQIERQEYQSIIKVEILGIFPVVLFTYSRNKFDFFYLFYLPFLMSLTCMNKELTLVNTILILNILEFSLPQTVIIQSILLGWVHHLYHLSENILLAPIPVILNHCFARIFSKISLLKSLDIIECNLFSVLLTNILFLVDSDTIYFHVLKVTLSALFLSILLNLVISITILKNNRSPYLRSFVLFSSFAISFPILVTCILKSIDDKTPIYWLFYYIQSSQKRQFILGLWLSILLLAIPTIAIFKDKISLNTSRKIWHFLILFFILKPFKMDPNFVKIALCGAIIMILSVEYLRYLNLEPFGEHLNVFLSSFADERDLRGPFIISYIYLIIGVSAPLLLKDSPVGLISLGIGDSMASIVGKKLGRFKWPNSNKTVEGTLAFIVCTSISCIFLQRYLDYFHHIRKMNLVLMCSLTGILEGNSIMNDNILIPAFMLICEQLFTY